VKEYDVIIIGGGGGAKLRPVSDLGKKVAVIERDALGGTCLNRGCIPSKMLIHSADVAEEIKSAEKYNLVIENNLEVQFEQLTTRVNQHVSGISKSIAESYEENSNVDFYHGTARFLEDKVVEVNGEKLTAKYIFIAAGARPNIPEIDGLMDTPFMTSTEALKAKKQPKKMIVIGGGYIAVELGYFYSALGTEVEFIVRSSMLKHSDQETVEEFQKVFSENHKIHQGYTTEKVQYENEEFSVTVKDKNGKRSQLKADALLVAAGITPNSDTLHLENTEIKTNNGYIEVDDRLQTAVENVYALGDIVGNYFFRHSVNFEGEYLLRTLFTNPSDESIKYPPMPHAVFTNPQIAGVGKTEQQLITAGLKREKDYIVGLNHYKDSAMGGDALMMDHGFAKLIFDASNKKLIGAHIVGPEASNMIHTPIAFMNMEATIDDMLRTIYIHPAMPEIVRNAARKANGAFA